MVVCFTGTIHNAKDAIIVANGVLPPVLVTVPGEDKHSSLHSRILGQKPHQQVTVKVRKVPRKMFGVPHKVHSPTPDELHHLQEVQELDNVFHHVEDEHHKAQEEHHRDPIKTHYSVDSSGRINHVTVEEMMAYKDAHNSHVSHEQIMKEKEALSAKLAREERQHARLHTASEKLVSELLYEDHLPQAEPEKNASSKDGVDLEKDDWLQDKQEKQGHKWPILLVLVAIAILAAVRYHSCTITMAYFYSISLMDNTAGTCLSEILQVFVSAKGHSINSWLTVFLDCTGCPGHPYTCSHHPQAKKDSFQPEKKILSCPPALGYL